MVFRLNLYELNLDILDILYKRKILKEDSFFANVEFLIAIKLYIIAGIRYKKAVSLRSINKIIKEKNKKTENFRFGQIFI